MIFRHRTLSVLTLVIAIAAIVLSAVWNSSSSSKLLIGLGDSYASGEGLSPYAASSDTATDKCHQSISGAYPVIAAQSLKIKSENLACSGATTDSMLNGTTGAPSQLVGLKKASVITITIGGNDINALGAVITPPSPGQLATQLSQLQPKLVSAYKRVQQAAPKAKIVVVGYPSLIPATPTAGCFIPSSEIGILRSDLSQLNLTVSESAKLAAVAYSDPGPEFVGHELCSAAPWINGIDFANFSASLHPTLDGQKALADAAVKTDEAR